MSLKKYKKINNKHFIAGWYIDKKICDQIVEVYKKTPEALLNKGGISKYNKIITDKSVKDSSDLYIFPDNDNEPFKKYMYELQKCINEYQKIYSTVSELDKFAITKAYNIQHYKKGGGFKKWHNERSGLNTCERILVFMTFLNDVPDGGTMFKHQKLTIPAEKGLTLIWPTDWTHEHKGQISLTKEKYIATGWFNFVL